MDKDVCYVYVAKNEEDFKSISASAVVTNKYLPLSYDEQLNCFIICKTEACFELENQLRHKRDVKPAILKFFNECRRNRVFENAETEKKRIVFLIHFGGRNELICREQTIRMNQAVADDSILNRHYFVSLSRFHRSPSFFFTNRDDDRDKLRAPGPEDDTDETNAEENRDDPFVIRLIKKWEKQGSVLPDYDHLRGITILCRALLETGEEERKKKLTWPGTEWWFQTIWNGTHPDIKQAFSRVEQKVLEQDEVIRDFCSEFFKEKVDLNQQGVDLSNIMSWIITTLNNINRRTGN